jgi:transcription initiation factor TFIIB
MDTEAGEEVCGDCGLVISDNILNAEPEWRSFTDSETQSRSRMGAVTSYVLYDKGLFTGFNRNRDANGKHLSLETRDRMMRLKKYDNRTKRDETWSRNLSIAMTELDRLSTALSIPQRVKEHAALIYRKALKRDLVRGRSIDAFVAASVYAACRFQNIPRPLKSISKESKRELSEVSRTYRLLLQELELKMPLDEPFKFVPGIASKLKLEQSTENQAIKILRRAKERYGLSGKDPRGVVAAALYLACVENGEKRIQKDVAIAAGTTEVTLRNRLRGLMMTLSDQANT